MKIVKNTSMQGLNIPFGTPDGTKTFFLAPQDRLEIPNTWKSKIAENLVHRRLVKIINIADPAPKPVQPVQPNLKTKKTIRKSS